MPWVLASSIALGGLLIASGVWGLESGIFCAGRQSFTRVVSGSRLIRLLALLAIGISYLAGATILIHRHPTGVIGFVVGGGPAIIAILYRFMELV